MYNRDQIAKHIQIDISMRPAYRLFCGPRDLVEMTLSNKIDWLDKYYKIHENFSKRYSHYDAKLKNIFVIKDGVKNEINRDNVDTYMPVLMKENISVVFRVKIKNKFFDVFSKTT
jgi:hypothetical protein